MQEGVDHATEAAVPTDQAAAVQSAPVADAAPSTEGQTPGGTPDTHPEEYTPEQIRQWRADSENKSAWQKAQTERDQQLAEMRRQLEQERQSWYGDPTVQQIMQAKAIMQQDPTLQAELERYNATGGKPQGPMDPYMAQLATKLRQSEDRLRKIEFQAQEADRSEVERQIVAKAETFRSAHEDEFPNTPDGDAAFTAFYNRMMAETDVVEFEDAYLLLERDKVIAKARESARAELAAVKADQLAASTGIQPGAADEEAFRGYRNDSSFRKTRENAMQHDNYEWEE